MKDEGGTEEGKRSYPAPDGVVENARIAEEAENLRPRTKRFSLRIIRMFTALPTAPAAQILGKQVLRSGTSIGANYREACRARSDAEFISKLGDCLKELDETAYWLELLAESEIVPTAKLSGLQTEVNELLAIFTAISKTQKSRTNHR